MICKVLNCGQKHHSFGYCNKHRENFKRNGRIAPTSQEPRPAVIEGAVAKLPLGKEAKDGYALIDAVNSPLSAYKWHFDGRYPATRINDEKIRLHRLLKPRIKGLVIDHINNDSLDNRLSNLRYLTHADNIKNQPRKEFLRG